jgi:hypothetical protein
MLAEWGNVVVSERTRLRLAFAAAEPQNATRRVPRMVEEHRVNHLARRHLSRLRAGA